MVVDGLIIPTELESLLQAGKWPRNRDEANQQNLKPLIPEDRNRTLRKIYLYPPPFLSVAKIIADSGKDFYSKFGAVSEILPEACIEIGDFGLGSDTPILLDYRAGAINPRVIHLEWPGNGDPNYYVVMASDFAGFIELLGI